MGILGDFIDSARDLALCAVRANKEGRKEIRDTVIGLTNELCRSLDLTMTYLHGVKIIPPDSDDLPRYLRGARASLAQSFGEFRICGGLYDLRDKFRQVFDPTKYAIKIGNINRIQRLVGSLQQTERGILDDMTEMFIELEDMADAIESLPKGTEERAEAHKEILLNVQMTINSLQQTQKNIVGTGHMVMDDL